MGVPLAKGGNASLSKQAPGLTAVTVGLGWQAVPGHDLDASALLCGESGKVLSDDHFVFFNNPSSPDGSVTFTGNAAPGSGQDIQQIQVDLGRVPADVSKVVFPVSIYDGAVRGQSFDRVCDAYIRVVDRDDGAELSRYDLATRGLSETAMVFGELYRHGAEWKFRAVGQGYASGLAGIAMDYGVDVFRESDASPSPAPEPTVHPQPVAPAQDMEAHTPPASAYQPGMSAPPAPIYAGPQVPAIAVQEMPTAGASEYSAGSSSVTCFFDPGHGPGMAAVTWYPQWGVPRQIQACGSCAQRVQTTPPPYYTPPQAAYAQPGYPQTGYAQPPSGYPYEGHAPHHTEHHQQQGGGRRFGAGALIGAGAAGLVGGALLNEAFDDDEPDVIVNNYYEEE
ncbi:hypothetical protein Sm713_69170 [Streptomyces sp. TS71-3]|nr:hypothetical protein Sm713_69170 [Streptomyces sp. TS71-3]